MQQQDEVERVRRESEEARAQAELDEYERKLRGRRRKPRKQRAHEEEPTWMHRYGYKVNHKVFVDYELCARCRENVILICFLNFNQYSCVH